MSGGRLRRPQHTLLSAGCSAMKIARVEAFHVAAPGDYQASAGLRVPTVQVEATPPRALDANTGRHLCVYPPRAETLLVRITTDDGYAGWGEAHSPPVPAVSKAIVEQLFAPQLIGQDPLAIEVLWDRLYASMRLRGHNTGFMLEALAGVDIALWDLAGKLMGQPIYRLLGGPFRTAIPCYASGVPGTTPDERIEAARRQVALGFTTVKLSIGRQSLARDLELAEALAHALRGEADVLVDAHGCYDARTAVEAGRRLERAGVRWLEDPLPPEDLEGYAALCAALDLPVASGETECTRWQFHQKLRRRAADIILPDICRAGGISEGRKIALVADLFNVPWCAHVSIGSWIHLAAAVHLAAASPNFLLCEYPNPLAHNPLGDPLFTRGLTRSGGAIHLPEGPGLGLTIDEDAVRAHTVPHA
jgi:L-alanine-DL-glutamate epimerase-like enolase superfamily enzyme